VQSGVGKDYAGRKIQLNVELLKTYAIVTPPPRATFATVFKVIANWKVYRALAAPESEVRR
jgi:hypothetical protein